MLCLSVKVILSRDADSLLVGLEDCRGVVMLSHVECLAKSPELLHLDTGLTEHDGNSCYVGINCHQKT